jgi:hypothetical protein
MPRSAPGSHNNPKVTPLRPYVRISEREKIIIRDGRRAGLTYQKIADRIFAETEIHRYSSGVRLIAVSVFGVPIRHTFTEADDGLIRRCRAEGDIFRVIRDKLAATTGLRLAVYVVQRRANKIGASLPPPPAPTPAPAPKRRGRPPSAPRPSPVRVPAPADPPPIILPGDDASGHLPADFVLSPIYPELSVRARFAVVDFHRRPHRWALVDDDLIVVDRKGCWKISPTGDAAKIPEPGGVEWEIAGSNGENQ